MDVFDKLIGGLVGREGGYVNHPNDRGGETIWGITVAVARANGYSGPMRSMTREQAVSIYRRRYWDAPGFAAVASISERIAEELFDTGVNMGVDARIPQKWLQRSLNLCNRQGADYADIAVDGVIGNGTLGALKALFRKRGKAPGEELMLKCLNGFQFGRYVEITEGRVKNEDFFVGWVSNRVGF